MSTPLPPLPAKGSVRIEIFSAGIAPPPVAGDGVWDTTTFDSGDVFASSALTHAVVAGEITWRDITPQSVNARIAWGADDPAGVLTVPAAGSWMVRTYDPERLLDPSNGASPYVVALRPGKPIRLSYINEIGDRFTVRQGLLDEITYDLITRQGTLRGTDQIQLLVGAKLPEGQDLDVNMPTTLRARAAYLINKAGLSQLVEIEGGTDYSHVIAESNPTAWWRFDETSGTVCNDSVGNLDGTYNAPTLGEPPLGAGMGTSVKFFWGTGFVDIVTPLVLPPTWTWEGWLMIDVLPTVPADLVLRANAPQAPHMRLNELGEVEVWRGSTTKVCHSGITLSLGIPHHLMFIRPSADEMLIFVDGQDVTVPDNTVVFTAAPGGDVLLFELFSGWVDEWAYYDHALNANYASLHYRYGVGQAASEYDPPVGPISDREASVWQHILTAAYDALYAVWMDRLAVLRFRSFGNPRDIGLQIGGVDGIAIDTMASQSSLSQVFTKVVGYDMLAPDVPVAAVDQSKADIYGEILLHRNSPVPNAQVWVDSVLADRSGAALQYSPGTLRIQTPEQLQLILAMGMIDLAHMVVESVDPTINVPARVLGAAVEANTDTGWSAQVIAYIPAKEWEEIETPPIEPPPVGGVAETRTYICTKDARLAGGSINGGNGTDNQIAVGYWQGYRNRMLMDFTDIPWGDVASIDKCELWLYTSGQVCCGFGSSPKVIAKRVTAAWNEGTYSYACGFATSNAVKYPGPATTSSESVTKAIPRNEDVQVKIDITAIARAWFNGSAQEGVMLVSSGEDSLAYTTEFQSRHISNAAKRPQLKLTVRLKA